MAGGLSSILLVAWISLGTQAQIARGKISFQKKPFSVSGCSPEQLSGLNASHAAAAIHLEYKYAFTKVAISDFWPTRESAEDVFYLFRLSYLRYTLIGVLTAITVGLLVSFLTGANKPQDVDPRLLSPAIRRFISYEPKHKQKFVHGESHELRAAQTKLLSPAK